VGWSISSATQIMARSTERHFAIHAALKAIDRKWSLEIPRDHV
jgi:hypothetical protein